MTGERENTERVEKDEIYEHVKEKKGRETGGDKKEGICQEK